MQIWYFIKFLGKCCFYAAQGIVGWFILGRSCRRCKYVHYGVFGVRYCWYKHEDEYDRVPCEETITKKHFRREENE